MKKHNTKPTVNVFNKLSLWALTYFAVSVAFVADVVVVYLGQRLSVVKIIIGYIFNGINRNRTRFCAQLGLNVLNVLK